MRPQYTWFLPLDHFIIILNPHVRNVLNLAVIITRSIGFSWCDIFSHQMWHGLHNSAEFNTYTVSRDSLATFAATQAWSVTVTRHEKSLMAGSFRLFKFPIPPGTWSGTWPTWHQNKYSGKCTSGSHHRNSYIWQTHTSEILPFPHILRISWRASIMTSSQSRTLVLCFNGTSNEYGTKVGYLYPLYLTQSAWYSGRIQMSSSFSKFSTKFTLTSKWYIIKWV